MPTWPGTLPQIPLVDGYAESPPDTLIRSEVDAGVPKVRRRYTAGVRPIRASLLLTKAQVEALDDFYIATLQNGALRFDWTHPRTQAAVEMRLTAPPAYEPIEPDDWRVSLELEVLP